MGANVRSTVGTVTDANAMLRVVFSRIGRPHIGGPQAFSFNVPSVRGGGAIKIERGAGKTESRTFSVAGGMCPRCEGMGSATDIDLTQLYDESKSLAEGAITVPGYTADGWSTRMFSESGFFDPDKPIRDYTADRAARLPLQGADQGQDQRHQPDLRGAGAADPEVVAVQGRRRAAAAHPRLRGAGGDVQRVPRLRRHPAQRGGALVEDRGRQHRRRLRDADQRPGRVGPRPGRAVGRAAAGGARATASTRSSRWASATSASTGRRARSRAARRSARG